MAMLMVYKTCILSRIDYGAQAYSCTAPQLPKKQNQKKQLNIIQNKALKIIANVPNTFSGKGLEVEFNIMPLEFIRNLQHLKYHLKIHSLKINHPVQDLMPVGNKPGQMF